jgi:hypothetical protein
MNNGSECQQAYVRMLLIMCCWSFFLNVIVDALGGDDGEKMKA